MKQKWLVLCQVLSPVAIAALWPVLGYSCTDAWLLFLLLLITASFLMRDGQWGWLSDHWSEEHSGAKGLCWGFKDKARLGSLLFLPEQAGEHQMASDLQ